MRELQPGQGRFERTKHTLQDRLLKELRLADVSSIEAGNNFLPGFVESFNERFAVRAAKPDDVHRKLEIAASRISDILCYCKQRYVGAQLTLSYDRKRIILERDEVSEELAGQYVELYYFPDRPLEMRWKGPLLPYRVFAKDQRVSCTAILENKRLGHVLRIVKAQQDVHQSPTVQTKNSSKGGYQKRGRRIYGPNYIGAPSADAVEMTN